MNLLESKFRRVIARVGDIMVYEYDFDVPSGKVLYLVRDHINDGAWLYSSLEAAMKCLYDIK